MPTPRKNTGVLMYGNRVIAENKPFSLLEGIKKELLMMGYEKSLFHKHYEIKQMNQTTPTSTIPAPVPASVPTADPTAFPDLKKHIPAPGDRTWLENYLSAMGEEAFFDYRDKIYSLLDRLEVGQQLPITMWCKPQNIDLFVKIAYCYITENHTYRFENGYNIITNKYHAGEMEELRSLGAQIAERRKEAGSDSKGA